jgi:hypothetical protein
MKRVHGLIVLLLVFPACQALADSRLSCNDLLDFANAEIGFPRGKPERLVRELVRNYFPSSKASVVVDGVRLVGFPCSDERFELRARLGQDQGVVVRFKVRNVRPGVVFVSVVVDLSASDGGSGWTSPPELFFEGVHRAEGYHWRLYAK